jgi:Na+/H+-dicarboxylate symporter
MTRLNPLPPAGISRRFTAWSLAALILGLALGFLLEGPQPFWVERTGNALRTMGRIWMVALQYTIVPLVVSHALLAMLSSEKLGVLGARTLLLIAGLLVGTAILIQLLGPLLLALYRPSPTAVSALLAGIEVAESPEVAAGEPNPGGWLQGWLPAGIARLLRGGGLLPVLIITLSLGGLGRLLPGPARSKVLRVVRKVADFAMRVVGWILVFTPVGVLALGYGFARGGGLGALGFFLVYVTMVSALLLVVTGLLYPVTVLLSRRAVTLRRFARAAAGPQLVAIGTRSSLASLPAMVESGRTHLGLPAAGTGVVLPLTVAIFKLNLAISAPFMLLFLGHAFGIGLTPGTILTFVATVLLLSFGVVGLPGGNPGLPTLPAFVAAGIPMHGPLVLNALDAIPDIFKTLLNVTADLSVATILTAPARDSVEEGIVEPAPGRPAP